MSAGRTEKEWKRVKRASDISRPTASPLCGDPLFHCLPVSLCASLLLPRYAPPPPPSPLSGKNIFVLPRCCSTKQGKFRPTSDATKGENDVRIPFRFVWATTSIVLFCIRIYINTTKLSGAQKQPSCMHQSSKWIIYSQFSFFFLSRHVF